MIFIQKVLNMHAWRFVRIKKENLRMEEISEETGEITGCLCGDVVEINGVANTMHH